MAHVKDNLIIKGTTGAVGKQIVLKEINGKTFMSKYPDMSGVKYNKTQIGYQNLFAQAIEYGQGVLADPGRKAAYMQILAADKRHRDKSVYHFAIQCYMKKHSLKLHDRKVEKILHAYIEKSTFTARQAAAIIYLIKYKKMTNSLYQQLNDVSRATATRDLRELVKKQIIVVRGKGAGAIYNLIPLETEGATEGEGNRPDVQDDLI